MVIRLGRKLFTFDLVREIWQNRYVSVPTTGIPWSPLKKSLEECRLVLVTTGGVHLRTDTPFDKSDSDGDPSFRLIPSEAEAEKLMITHDYYDHRDADQDLNLVFPWQVIQALSDEGRIGSQTEHFISFMGHIDGSLIQRLTSETAVEAADRIQAMQTDIALLVPA